MSTPHWNKHWEQIATHLATRSRLLLACDFDGTLAPIAARPEEAELPEPTRDVLRKLMRGGELTLAFVSGRGLADLRVRVGIDGAIYCGNHGLEIEGPGFTWTNPEAILRRPAMAAAIATLRRGTAGMDGVLIEDKGLTTTAHWRLASAADREALRLLMAQVMETHTGLRLSHGKAVWELRPRVDWDKGAALRQLLCRAGLEGGDALFLGDDVTDESAFRAIPDGLTVHVGEAAVTAARFFAKDEADAAGFLVRLADARADSSYQYSPETAAA